MTKFEALLRAVFNSIQRFHRGDEHNPIDTGMLTAFGRAVASKDPTCSRDALATALQRMYYGFDATPGDRTLYEALDSVLEEFQYLGRRQPTRAIIVVNHTSYSLDSAYQDQARALGRRVAASLARHRGRFYFIDIAPARRTDRPALGELCEAVGASPTVCHSFLQLDTVLLRVG